MVVVHVIQYYLLRFAGYLQQKVKLLYYLYTPVTRKPSVHYLHITPLKPKKKNMKQQCRAFVGVILSHHILSWSRPGSILFIHSIIQLPSKPCFDTNLTKRGLFTKKVQNSSLFQSGTILAPYGPYFSCTMELKQSHIFGNGSPSQFLETAPQESCFGALFSLMW